MARGAILLVLALMLMCGRAGALGPFQPDVTIAERGDPVSAGDDIYGADAAGQTRSIIVEKRVVLVVRVQNDGTGDCSYDVTGSAPAGGFDVRYVNGGLGRGRASRGAKPRDVTTALLDGTLVLQHLRPGDTRTLSVVVTARPDAPLGAEQPILVTARSTTEPDQVDAARATVTKVSEAVGP